MTEQPGSRIVFRLALATAIVTFLLLSVGGVVTSRDAGMIFRDWPTSNGSFNPDGWLAHPDKRAEHGHRLIGMVVGLLTIALAVALYRKEPRRQVRWLGYGAFVAVGLQGLLGGLRVTEDDGTLALLHGCTGQAFFALVVAVAYMTSRDAALTHRRSKDLRGLYWCGIAVILAIFVQVVLGAQLRHHTGPIDTHLVGAMMVGTTVFWLLTVVMFRHPEKDALRRPVLLLAGLLLMQVALGFYSARILAAPGRVNSYTLTQVMVPTAHQSIGALMLATAVLIVLRTSRRVAPLGSKAQGTSGVEAAA